MIDKILEIGSTPDWVTPLLATVEDLVRGPCHTFLVPHDCGWSGYEIRKLLIRFGIELWGLMVVSDTLMFSVPKKQARWAQVILSRHGIPVDNPFFAEDSPCKGATPGHLEVAKLPPQSRQPSARPANVIERVEGFCEALASRLQRFP